MNRVYFPSFKERQKILSLLPWVLLLNWNWELTNPHHLTRLKGDMYVNTKFCNFHVEYVLAPLWPSNEKAYKLISLVNLSISSRI